MNTQTQLERLENAALIRRAQAEPDIEYWFRHGLMHETTYDGLLKQDRRRLHELVAHALEVEGAGAEDAWVARLAEHWDKAGDARRALTYYVRAGQAAMRVYARPEALMAFEQARRLATETDVTNEQWLELYTARGRALELDGQYRAALENYIELEKLGVTRDAPTLEMEGLAHSAMLHATPSPLMNADEAVRLSEHALELARRYDDRALQARILWGLTLAYQVGEQPDKAVVSGEESLALAQALELREQLAFIQNDLSRVYFFTGRAPEALELRAQAEQYWREVGNLPMLADSLATGGLFCLFTGQIRQGIVLTQEALEISRRTSNGWGESFACETLGMLYLQVGELDAALIHLTEGARLSERSGYLGAQLTGFPLSGIVYRVLGAPALGIAQIEPVLKRFESGKGWLAGALAMLTMLYLQVGRRDDADRALALAEQDLREGFDSAAPYMTGLARVEVALAHGELARAGELVRELLALFEQTNMAPFRAYALTMLGVAREQMGDAEGARKAYEASYEHGKLAQDRPGQFEAALHLARLSAAEPEGEAWRERARKDAQFIADHAPPDLKETFLAQARVSALFL